MLLSNYVDEELSKFIVEREVFDSTLLGVNSDIWGWRSEINFWEKLKEVRFYVVEVWIWVGLAMVSDWDDEFMS